MINFAELEIKINTKYSFVGIQKEGSQLILYIPKGFCEDDINTFDKKRDLFFRLYRVLNVFKQICIEKGYLKENNPANDRDGVLEVDTGSEITSDDDSKNIFYSKLDALGSILDAYDELKILALVSRLGKSERIDYSKLHRYLNKAVFLNNGAIYIDTMTLPRKEIHFDATDIVAMYCYILTEIKEQLQQQVNPEIKSLAERFQEKYLGIESSLFNEKYYLRVINELKDALDLIDHHTPIKDSDYWDFYEAIYKFLFGELDNSVEGEVWGFSNFHTIWESMCLTYLVRILDPTFILYLDKQFISDKILNEWNNYNKIIDISKIFILKDTDNPSDSDKESKLRPDAVIISCNQANLDLSVFKNDSQNEFSIKYELRKPEYINNDYFIYYTDINCYTVTNHKKVTDAIKIAYLGKTEERHTYDILCESLKTNIIDSNISLPQMFYSYWDIKEISINEIKKMRCLNHIFYKALEMKNIDFKNFLPSFLQNVFISSTNIYNNIIFDSLVRKRASHRDPKEMNENINQINKMFANFINELHFYIIDIKYYEQKYYTNSENIEKIKSRSVRKQFVYEYLLQKHLEKTNHPLKELNIKSEFWLPAYSENKETFTPLPKYMDDYIKLTGVNIMTVIDSYLQTEEK
jgi:hypothetical protein